MTSGPDDLMFADDTAPAAAAAGAPPWVALIVDDDPDVHVVTRLCLKDFSYEGRGIEWLSAHSAAEGRTLLESRNDIALILLDVVMETDRAGLDLAREVRGRMQNLAVRIVVRTGQPGETLPMSVIDDYGVDDFRVKTELSFDRMSIMVKGAFRTYRRLRELEEQGRRLVADNEELRRAVLG